MARPGGEVTGTIYSIGETQQVTERFRKRVLVLTFGDNPKYPQHVEFQTVGDRCSILDSVAEGQIVTLHYNLGGRLRKNGDGCFNALEIWKIDEARGATAPPARRPPPAMRDSGPPPSTIDDDIPF